MKNSIAAMALLATMAMPHTANSANYAWPANYEGVMLQAFYWDSYADTKWTNLTEQSDELSQYFSLIWVPNSAKASGSQNMGYMPIYWFTNHDSSFGNRIQLKQMITTFREKGTGVIADVVVNHRAGLSNWTDFPVETWNGRTWSIGPEGICSTDEVRNQPGQAKPTGAPDTGDDFDGARDLDHTNANVQDNVKNYALCLLQEYGYAGFRYDMVKGYAGRFTKIYNEYAKPTFSVGEYFDGSYDAVAAWIEATGRQSAAFDFPLKFVLNDAFASGDMSKLVWLANGTNPQPAGMIHFGYPQYSVTFVDNHDTYRDNNKFNGNVLAANAFILCSPGTPCIFLPHWQQHKSALKKLIDVRNNVGVHNMSAVKVLRYDRNCYMAEVTGSKGSLVVRIGSDSSTPSGYTSADIKAQGNGYCVWSKQGGSSEPGDNAPEQLYLMGHISQGAWATNAGVKMTKDGSTFTAHNVNIVKADDSNYGFFSFVTALGTTGSASEWDAVINASDRYGATSKDEPISPNKPSKMKVFYGGADASSAYSWAALPGSYSVKADFAAMTVTLSTPSGIDAPEASSENDDVYYNLQGVRVDNPTGGVYIRIRNGKAEKVLIGQRY